MKHSKKIWHKLFFWELRVNHTNSETTYKISLKRRVLSSFIALLLAFALGSGCTFLFWKPNTVSQTDPNTAQKAFDTEDVSISETETLQFENIPTMPPSEPSKSSSTSSNPTEKPSTLPKTDTSSSTTQTNFSSKEDSVMIAELLETLPTLEGDTFLERYEEFQEKGYSLPSGTYYLNEDFTSPAMEDDYLHSSGNLEFHFYEERICICLHRNTSKAFDFNCEFILFERIVYQQGDNIIVEGIDNAIGHPRIYRYFELHSDGTYTYKGEHLKNADITDSNQKILQADFNGTVVLDENELALYYLGSKKCFVTLPQGKIIPFSPRIDDESFYEAPFIIDGKLMCIQSYCDANDEPKMVLHTLATNVEKVCESIYVDRQDRINNYTGCLIQYTNGSYGLLRFCKSSYQDYLSGLDGLDSSSYYWGCSFDKVQDYTLVSSNISEIAKFEPKNQIHSLHFEQDWWCYGQFKCWYLIIELNEDNNQYLQLFLPDFYYGMHDLELPHEEAKANFSEYAEPFSLQEYDSKLAQLTALMKDWQSKKLS